MKLLPIGQSDYKNLIDNDLYYVDKTLFIHELITRGGLVNLFPRPRRFGKTLNLSMIRYFFEKTEKSSAYLFEDKKIWQIPEIRALQGKFPVIFLTFKDIKESRWDITLDKIMGVVAKEYTRHNYLLTSGVLHEHERALFENICRKQAALGEYHQSLSNLSHYLERYHQKKVIILVGEYDSPIHAGFLNNYYQEVIELMRGLLCGAFKDNESLERGIITGILHTAKEGIFSGLNNLETFTLLSNDAADKFGFTEQEIGQMLQDFDLTSVNDYFRSWYNGYLIGDIKIYNPWSSLSCIKNQGRFASYWVSTSDNGLIKKIIATSQPEIKDACAELIAGNVLPDIQIDDRMVLSGITHNSSSIWNLFLFTGYLTMTSRRLIEGIQYVDLVIPNKELVVLFNQIISELFKERIDFSDLRHLATALEEGNGQLFETLLAKFILSSASFHDIHEDDPEKSYHLFALGLLVAFGDRYAVKSNRESGYGRFDIMLVPKDRTKLGLVIEFKKKDKKETLSECANRALQQITSKHYATELRGFGIEQIAFFGIACYKKKILLKQA